MNDLQQKVEAQQRSYRENVDQLAKKMEREKENLLREQERLEQHKQQVTLGGSWACLQDCNLIPHEERTKAKVINPEKFQRHMIQ